MFERANPVKHTDPDGHCLAFCAGDALVYALIIGAALSIVAVIDAVTDDKIREIEVKEGTITEEQSVEAELDSGVELGQEFLTESPSGVMAGASMYMGFNKAQALGPKTRQLMELCERNPEYCETDPDKGFQNPLKVVFPDLNDQADGSRSNGEGDEEDPRRRSYYIHPNIDPSVVDTPGAIVDQDKLISKDN